MVDEKVVDQVWVTVVATGYGDRPRRRTSPHAEASRDGLSRAAREADREPRVARSAAAGLDIDVPEFIPRGR
jgi:cell division protein FtsZ